MNKSKVIGITALVLALVLLTASLGLATKGFKDWNIKNWFNKAPATSGETVTDGDGNILDSNTVYEMPSNLVFKSPSAQSTAEEGINMKITVTPSNATDIKLNCTLTWQNPNSQWAMDKTTDTYFELAPPVHSAPAEQQQLNLKCLQAFGEVAILTVFVVDNPEIFATCVIDYVKRLISYDVKMGDTILKTNAVTLIDFCTVGSALVPNTFTLVTNKSVGTKELDLVSPTFSYSLNSSFVTGLDSLKIANKALMNLDLVLDIPFNTPYRFGGDAFKSFFGEENFNNSASFNEIVSAFISSSQLGNYFCAFSFNLVDSVDPTKSISYKFNADLTKFNIKVENIEIDGSLEF